MGNDANNQSGRKIRSVGITFDIIEILQEKGSTGLTELSEELDHSKSTIHNHLRTLEGYQMVVREDGGYRLSLRVLEIATCVREQVGNYDVIRDEVDTLARETGEIAQFGIEEHGKLSYLHKRTGEHGVETASRVGTKQPIYSTALGKTILAHLPSKRTSEIVADIEFEQITPHTITSRTELYSDLEKIQDRGYGIDDEENIEGLRCVAAPVTDGENVLGAISLSGPSRRFSIEKIHSSLSDEVQRAANVIELNTKFA